MERYYRKGLVVFLYFHPCVSTQKCHLREFGWQTTVILLPGVEEPGSFLNGVTSFPLDPVDPLDPLDPVMNSERAPMYCKKQYSGRFCREK